MCQCFLTALRRGRLAGRRRSRRRSSTPVGIPNAPRWRRRAFGAGTRCPLGRLRRRRRWRDGALGGGLLLLIDAGAPFRGATLTHGLVELGLLAVQPVQRAATHALGFVEAGGHREPRFACMRSCDVSRLHGIALGGDGRTAGALIGLRGLRLRQAGGHGAGERRQQKDDEPHHAIVGPVRSARCRRCAGRSPDTRPTASPAAATRCAGTHGPAGLRCTACRPARRPTRLA